MSVIRFVTLGGIDLRDENGAALNSLLAQPKRVAVLAYLAAGAHGSFVRRDEVVAVFWPEHDQSRARQNLRKSVYMIRRTLGAEALLGRGDEELSLNPERVSCDLTEFRGAVQAHDWCSALRLWRGDFLEALHVPGAPPFDAWLQQRRREIHAEALTAVRARIEELEQQDAFDDLVELTARALVVAPTDESLLRHQIRGMDRLGRRAEALELYQDFEARLVGETGVEPSPETQQVVEEVRSRECGDSSQSPIVDARPPTPAPPRPRWLPDSTQAGTLTATMVIAGAAFFGTTVARGGATMASAPLVSYLTAWLVALVGIWFLFERAEETVSSSTRGAVARLLSGGDRGRSRDWPATFESIFDQVFGRLHVSLSCLLRSMAASCIAVTLLLLLWLGIRPEAVRAFAESRGADGLAELIIITFIVNVLADYVSLLETRGAIRLARRANRTWVRGAILLGDALLTMAIWLLFFTGALLLLVTPWLPGADTLLLYVQHQIWEYGPTFYHVLFLWSAHDGPPIGVWFYSTFLTSAWLWAYLGSAGVMRAGRATGTGLRSVARVVDAENAPVRAMGFITMVGVTLLFVLGWFAQSIG